MRNAAFRLCVFVWVNVLFCFNSGAQVLKVSGNGRYIQTANGKPFLWLGDTAWELFHKLGRRDASLYLKDRAEKGFTVIQAVILAELDGLKKPNANGDLPLVNMDPSQPNEAYFKHVDFMVNEAEKLGLFIGMLPTWGDKVTPSHGGGPVIFNDENARVYGKFLGSRYKNKPVIWILGGDRNVQNEAELNVWRAMAEGLMNGDGGRNLISYHPRGPHSSHTKLHNESWLHFNMYQSGHSNRFRDVYRFAGILDSIEPRKPFVDAEPPYEDIPVEFWKYCDWSAPFKVPRDVLHADYTIARKEHFEQGFFNDHDVRVHAYWNFLSGASGYTYGNNAIWQMFEKGGEIAIPCLTDWREALDRPGAKQIRYLKKFFEAYPIGTFKPFQSVIAGQNPPDSSHIRAAVAKDGSFLLIYLSIGQEVTVKLNQIKGSFNGYWYNPFNGKASPLQKQPGKNIQTFNPPSSETNRDWLLVLERKQSSQRGIKSTLPATKPRRNVGMKY
jgi:hypothetical protein